MLQAADAATNQLLLLSVAVLFLVSLETRIKRRTALRMLHQLRSIAHVVDMHQLTKDPEHVLRPVSATASSPTRTLSHPQLARYLDYCSELLALTSKLAALHAQHLHDPVVLDAVNDIESLTADLSRKIWQKITILDITQPRGVPWANVEQHLDGEQVSSPGVNGQRTSLSLSPLLPKHSPPQPGTTGCAAEARQAGQDDHFAASARERDIFSAP